LILLLQDVKNCPRSKTRTAKEAHTHEVIKEVGMAVQDHTVVEAVGEGLIPDVAASSKKEVVAEAPVAISTTVARGQAVAASGETPTITNKHKLTVVVVAILEVAERARAILQAAIQLLTHRSQVVVQIRTKVERSSTTSRPPNTKGTIVPTEHPNWCTVYELKEKLVSACDDLKSWRLNFAGAV
jgi:hypothetical protein